MYVYGRINRLPCDVSVDRMGAPFGPAPLPLAVAMYSLPPDAEGRKARSMGIHSVGMEPMGSTMPCCAALRVNLLVSITATASLMALATYRRLPSALTARASGSAPK